MKEGQEKIQFSPVEGLSSPWFRDAYSTVSVTPLALEVGPVFPCYLSSIS
jgi:hypothetical protein